MSMDRQPSEPPSNLAVLRAQGASAARRLIQRGRSWMLDNRQLCIAALAVTLLSLPAVGILVVRKWQAAAARPTPAKTVALALEALAAWDAGELPRVRQILEQIDLAYLEPGQHTTIEFLQGALAASEADEYVGADRRPRFESAVVHLKRSREMGFPYRHEAQATFLLGKSLYHSGASTECRPVLEQSLQELPEFATEIHGMLAEAYQRTSTPDLKQAMAHNEHYLAAAELSDEQRQLATLRQAELLWKLGDVAACSQIIEQIQRNSPIYTHASILRGRILLHEAEQAQAALPAEATTDQPQAVRAQFEAALAVLQQARQDPLNTQVIGKAMYLIGVCHLRLGDTAAALEQLRRTARIYENTPEGLAAAMEEAELLRRLGRHAEAIQCYVRVFDDPGLEELDEADNPWMPAEQLRRRALEACEYYLRRTEYERAAQLIDHLAPLIPAARATEMAAELRRTWAAELLAVEDPSTTEAREQLARGRRMLREAGLLYREAARLNFADPQYTEDLWQSAECYRRGQNYTAAATSYEEYLKYEAKRRRSAALMGLGDCLLALDRPKAALDVLKQCYEMMPQDIASYSARLLASQAYAQLGDPQQAEELLRENIAGNLLTPASKEWRESLFMLGKLLVQQERHQEAIDVLSEAVARYPQTPPAVEARYLIAEEFRRAAQVPQQKAASDTIESVRAANLREVQKYLTAAIEHYEEAQRILNQRQASETLTPLEQAILRNSYFAVGMALFDLGRYEDAIRAYSTATNRYQHAPEVLEAFVQMAGCYRRLNRPMEARGTVRQAKVVLNRLPEQAPYEQATNFTRKQWTELLDWLITL